MIALPPSFDVDLFTSDIIAIAMPFIGIAGLFMTFNLIKKIANRI